MACPNCGSTTLAHGFHTAVCLDCGHESYFDPAKGRHVTARHEHTHVVPDAVTRFEPDEKPPATAITAPGPRTREDVRMQDGAPPNSEYTRAVLSQATSPDAEVEQAPWADQHLARQRLAEAQDRQARSAPTFPEAEVALFPKGVRPAKGEQYSPTMQAAAAVSGSVERSERVEAQVAARGLPEGERRAPAGIPDAPRTRGTRRGPTDEVPVKAAKAPPLPRKRAEKRTRR